MSGKVEKLKTLIYIMDGRLNRTDFCLIFFPLYLLDALNQFVFEDYLPKLSLIGVPIWAVLLWFTVSAYVKRLHDLNLSGWWIVVLLAAMVAATYLGVTLLNEESFDLLLFPFVYFITYAPILFLAVCPGTKGENKYGEYFKIFPNPLRKIIGNKIKFFS